MSTRRADKRRRTHPARVLDVYRSASVKPARGLVFNNESEKAVAFLARLGLEISSILSLPDLLGHVTLALREEIGFDSCIVSLLDQKEGEDVLIVRSASGLRQVMKDKMLPRLRGISWTVMEAGKPLVVLVVKDLRGEGRWFLKDERSRSGIYAPLVVGGGTIGVLSAYREAIGGFSDADLSVLTTVARYLANAIEVARLYEQLTNLAATDPLTGLANRCAILERMESEIARSRRTDSQFCFILLDLDHFKLVNDRGGHAIGDQLVRGVAERMVRAIRQSDVAARLVGDEFLFLLPESTPTAALDVVDRFRNVMASAPVLCWRSGISFSWGIAAWPQDGVEVRPLLQAADCRLYAMKGTEER
jgi:diguanylate cyclase (GGDEF)-like protein